jgi:hypothetical protein
LRAKAPRGERVTKSPGTNATLIVTKKPAVGVAVPRRCRDSGLLQAPSRAAISRRLAAYQGVGRVVGEGPVEIEYIFTVSTGTGSGRSPTQPTAPIAVSGVEHRAQGLLILRPVE